MKGVTDKKRQQWGTFDFPGKEEVKYLLSIPVRFCIDYPLLEIMLSVSCRQQVLFLETILMNIKFNSE